MTKIVADPDRCVGAGQCVLTDSDAFDQNEENGTVVVLQNTPADDEALKVRPPRTLPHVRHGRMPIQQIVHRGVAVRPPLARHPLTYGGQAGDDRPARRAVWFSYCSGACRGLRHASCVTSSCWCAST
jgi:ferredoxin